MLSIYPACFFEEKEGGYSVIFPGLNIATCGDTLEEAAEMAVDALAGWLYDFDIKGKAYPTPMEVQDINVNDYYDDYKEAFINIITVDVKEYARKNFCKSIKKTLTIPSWLNDLAVQQHVNFSQVLQSALKEQLGIE